MIYCSSNHKAYAKLWNVSINENTSRTGMLVTKTLVALSPPATAALYTNNSGTTLCKYIYKIKTEKACRISLKLPKLPLLQVHRIFHTLYKQVNTRKRCHLLSANANQL